MTTEEKIERMQKKIDRLERKVEALTEENEVLTEKLENKQEVKMYWTEERGLKIQNTISICVIIYSLTILITTLVTMGILSM